MKNNKKKLKPKKHKMDLHLLPTDIIKYISKHLIKNHDFRLNKIMLETIESALARAAPTRPGVYMCARRHACRH